MSGLVTQDFQVEFDGLLLGAGTPYGITAANGFLDMSGVRASFTPRARAHGGYTEPHFGGGAILDLALDINATSSTSFASAVLALESGTYPQQATRPLWFQFPGHTLRTMQVQVLRRAIPLTQAFTFGLVQQAALQFYAPDPLKYGQSQSGTAGLPSTTGGLAYPLTYPLAYGTVTAGTTSATNVGSADSHPLLTVTGPQDSAGFQITVIEDGLTLQYTGGLGATDSVVIDTGTGSVLLNGTDRRSLLSYSAWPVIPAGQTRTFAFTTLGSYQPAASLQVTWAPAYW